MQASHHGTLSALLCEQRALEAQVQDLDADPRRVLDAAQLMVQFSSHERQALATLAILDPDVQDELTREDEALAEDFELLRWLMDTTPDSPDVTVLATSLARRMRQHVERDGRLIASALHFC